MDDWSVYQVKNKASVVLLLTVAHLFSYNRKNKEPVSVSLGKKSKGVLWSFEHQESLTDIHRGNVCDCKKLQT